MSLFNRAKHVGIALVSQLKAHVKGNLLLNALLFQCLWFSIMLFEQLGLSQLLMALVVQFFIHYYHAKGELTLILPLVVFITGVVVDSSFSNLGLFTFELDKHDINVSNRQLVAIPLWLIALWAGLVLTLQNSLQWIRSKRYLSVFGFAVFGPVSYIAGRSLGMIGFNDTMILYLVIEWAFIGWFASFSFKKVIRNN